MVDVSLHIDAPPLAFQRSRHEADILVAVVLLIYLIEHAVFHVEDLNSFSAIELQAGQYREVLVVVVHLHIENDAAWSFVRGRAEVHHINQIGFQSGVKLKEKEFVPYAQLVVVGAYGYVLFLAAELENVRFDVVDLCFGQTKVVQYLAAGVRNLVD